MEECVACKMPWQQLCNGPSIMFVHNMFPETIQENVSNYPEIQKQQEKNKGCTRVICPRPQRVSKAMSALELQNFKLGESCFYVEEAEAYKGLSARPSSCPGSRREELKEATEPSGENLEEVAPPERTDNPMVRDHWFLFSNRTSCGCAKFSECPAREVVKHNANMRKTCSKSPTLSV